jgi:hypothetical protein
MRKSNRRKRTRIWVIISFSLLGLTYLIAFHLYAFLAKTATVSSQVLIVEGWARPFALQAAAVELNSKPYELLITTGGPLLKTGYLLSTNSSLNFSPSPNTLPQPGSLRQCTIKVLADGTAIEGQYAHFNLLVNDSIMAGSYTQADPRDYSFDVPIVGKAIQRISVAFYIDAFTEGHDRNMILYSITINGKTYTPFSPGVTYSYLEAGKRIVEPVCHTMAETSQAEIRKLGTQPMQMVAVNTPYVDIDRTYETAVAVRKWLEIHQPEATSINVLTEGVHARRSWMMYKKAFGPRYSIGIMAIDYPYLEADTWWQSWKGTKLVLTQLGKYLYAQFYFSPFA